MGEMNLLLQAPAKANNKMKKSCVEDTIDSKNCARRHQQTSCVQRTNNRDVQCSARMFPPYS